MLFIRTILFSSCTLILYFVYFPFELLVISLFMLFDAPFWDTFVLKKAIIFLIPRLDVFMFQRVCSWILSLLFYIPLIWLILSTHSSSRNTISMFQFLQVYQKKKKKKVSSILCNSTWWNLRFICSKGHVCYCECPLCLRNLKNESNKVLWLWWSTKWVTPLWLWTLS